MNKNAVNTIGFWSALLAFIFRNTFTVGAVVGGMFPKPWDAILPMAPVLLLAPTLVRDFTCSRLQTTGTHGVILEDQLKQRSLIIDLVAASAAIGF